ncbi:TetR/AcrR family transcriptional regulator [Streptomyces purpurogeneiscleroticus]|uniref:TetR/AcrR family transcriptional regulator n=1 Tax=Streptomyces purpurogeneiscleroticus TaxID=68259 RepID=UPI001CC1A7AC|nr:TetR family transcriptional regulator C-terminal domain-containing protein [Streptomyces purpurogeneiscleroticus]MBZ4014753.1 TetR family transcriptional regulator [Streptomyces purpurogeneiscleroticus]
MPSSVQRKRIRKSPADRRAEIVDAAASIALTEGLECITLRRIGEQLGVRPGLISHYFPAVEDLVAEAFGSAASAELDRLIPAERPDGTPTEHLARFFARATGEAYDDMSRLWINARHLRRYRPVLRDRVGVQEDAWVGRLSGLLRAGVERGEFRTDDPEVVAMQILVVIDGLGAYSNSVIDNCPPAVTRMAVTTAERELGLPSGALIRTTPN